MNVQIKIGQGIMCDNIEILFGNPISSVMNKLGEVYQNEDDYYFYNSSLLIHIDSNNCIDEIEVRNDAECSHVVILDGIDIFSEEKNSVVALIETLNQASPDYELGTFEARRIGLSYSFSMSDEEIEEMISEAKADGTYEEMKEEIEVEIENAKYLQAISVCKLQ